MARIKVSEHGKFSSGFNNPTTIVMYSDLLPHEHTDVQATIIPLNKRQTIDDNVLINVTPERAEALNLHGK